MKRVCCIQVKLGHYEVKVIIVDLQDPRLNSIVGVKINNTQVYKM